MADLSLLKELQKVLQPKKTTEPYDTTAEVRRIEGKTAWVHIPGGVDETPVEMTINAKEGDAVRVRVSGGQAWLMGNNTAPPTDDAEAKRAKATAGEAFQKANTAEENAELAAKAAESAQASAENASEYASRALVNLSTVQSVVETLTWITEHGTMALTTDTEIDPTHVYFVVDAEGDYVVGTTHYSVVTEPRVEDISTYYELSIDESLNNYVAMHLAVTNEGLWILPAATGYKILIATGNGTTYTAAGTYIIDASGDTTASFGSNVRIGKSTAENIYIQPNLLRFNAGDGIEALRLEYSQVSITGSSEKKYGVRIANNSSAARSYINITPSVSAGAFTNKLHILTYMDDYHFMTTGGMRIDLTDDYCSIQEDSSSAILTMCRENEEYGWEKRIYTEGVLMIENGIQIHNGPTRNQDPPYYLCLDRSFANGGDVGYVTKADMVSAIGAVAKAGDTMTGNLTIYRAAPGYWTFSSNVNSQIGETIPTGDNVAIGRFWHNDNQNYGCAYSEVIKTTADDLYRSYAIRRKNASGTAIVNAFYQHINASGEKTITFDSVATATAWKNALSIPSVNMGNPTIASGVGATVAQNTSCKTQRQVSINLRLTGATLAAGTADICTLPSGFRPDYQAFAVLLIDGVYRNGYVGSDGLIRVYGGVAVSSKEIKIMATFRTS